MTTYTEAQRDAAITLAAQVGDEAAAAQLGIPRRTISSWHHRPAQAVVIARTRQQFADQYAEAEAKALERVLGILRHPRSRPRDIIDAGEWVSKQRALLLGQATEISANMNVDVRGAVARGREGNSPSLREFLTAIRDATDEELTEDMARVAIETVRNIGDPTNPRDVAMVMRGIVMPEDIADIDEDAVDEWPAEPTPQ